MHMYTYTYIHTYIYIYTYIYTYYSPPPGRRGGRRLTLFLAAGVANTIVMLIGVYNSNIN